MSSTLDALEPRHLFASPVTYTLIELPLNIRDLNNADQLLAPTAIYQIHRGGRVTRTDLPTLNPNATLSARRINDAGVIIATETTTNPLDNSVTRQQVVIALNRHGQYTSRYLFDNTTPRDDQPNAPVVLNNANQILTDGGEDESLPDLTGDVRLITLGKQGASTSESANGLLHGGTRTIDLPLDLNNVGQVVTIDAHYPIDNFVTFRRGVGTLKTAEELADGDRAPVQHLDALNDRSQIVGATQQPGPDQHLQATLYQLSSRNRYYRTFLGTLPTHNTSESLAINNNAGQILGTSYITRSTGRTVDLTATITQPNALGAYAPLTDLNSLIPNPGNDRVTRPIAINDAGLILAEGVSTRNSTPRFLLLLPSRGNTSPITRTTSVQRSIPAPPLSPIPTPFATNELVRSEDNLW